MSENRNRIIKTIFFICGVSGCGKSTVGSLLSKALDIPFYDGDDFHPIGNIEKMRTGIPLDDNDREGWLEAISIHAEEHLGSCVIACSALKEIYRSTLRSGLSCDVAFFFLVGRKELIMCRINARKDHFMPVGLLDSQFEILEITKDVHKVSIEMAPIAIVANILEIIENKK